VLLEPVLICKLAATRSGWNAKSEQHLNSPRILLVTRHLSAREWIAARCNGQVHLLTHLRIEDVRVGDWVVGILPIPMVAAVIERGARFFNLDIEVPEAARGRELSTAELEAFGAKLVEYHVQRVDSAEVLK
jgi:CRISPR-associated protein Csx16